MRRAKTILAILAVSLGVGLVMAPTAVMAETIDTNIIGGGSVDVSDGNGIYDILRLIVTILTYGLGVAATIGVVIAGVMYLTAKDSPDKVAAAKKRLIEVVIGLVAWAVMAAVLNWLIPGGISLDTSTWGGATEQILGVAEEKSVKLHLGN